MICPLPAGSRAVMPTEEVGMTYTQAAVERAVKVHEVLMQALSGRQAWIHAGGGPGGERSRGPHAGTERTAALDSRRGGVGRQRAHRAAAALAVRAVRVHRALRPPAAYALAAGGAGGGSAAAAGALPRPLRAARRAPRV